MLVIKRGAKTTQTLLMESLEWWFKNGLKFTVCKLEDHIDVDIDVRFLNDWSIELEDGWIFNE